MLIGVFSLVPDINVEHKVNVDRYHTTNRTATCQRPLFVGTRGWPINSMVTVKIYDNGTYIGNSPHVLNKIGSDGTILSRNCNKIQAVMFFERFV